MALAPLGQTLLITSARLGVSVSDAVTVPSMPMPTPSPSPSLSLSSAVTHAEGDSGTVNFVWTLTLNRDGSTASFPYSWAITGNGGNPANAADFGGAFPSGTGTFAPGQTSKTITVPVTGDVTVESNETFLLTVTAAGLNTVTSTGTITNDDVEEDSAISAPVLTPQADPTEYPPAPAYDLPLEAMPGVNFRIWTSATYLGALNRVALIIDDASVSATGVYATDKAAINAKLAGISSGETYIGARVERGAVIGATSNVILHGTAAVPTITSSLDVSVTSTKKLSNAIGLTGTVANVFISGDDGFRFEAIGARPGQNFTERWLNNADTPAFAPAIDFDTNNLFERTYTPLGLNGVMGEPQSGTVTLLDYDTTADTPVFTAQTGKELSTQYPSNEIEVTGIEPDYVGNGTISGGEYQKNGDGVWRTAAFTYELGDTFKLRRTSSASYSTDASVTFALDAVSATWTITTKADPAGWAVLGMFDKADDEGFTSPHVIPNVVLKQGKNIIIDMPIFAQATDEIRIGTSSGQSASLRVKAHTDGAIVLNLRLWEITMAADYTGDLWFKTVGQQPTVVTVFCPSTGSMADFAVKTGAFISADAGTEISFDERDVDTGGDESDVTITKPSSGSAMFAVGTTTAGAVTSATSSTGLSIGAFNVAAADRFDGNSFILRIFQMNASGVPKFIVPTTGGQQIGVAASFNA